MIRIDVIIPTYKPIENILPLINEIERTAGCDVNVIPTCQDASASINRNYGLDRATSDPRIMLDDDIQDLPHGWVHKMAHLMLAYPECVMLSPELCDKAGKQGPMMGGPPRRPGVIGIEVCPSRRLLTACIAIRKWPKHIRFNEEMRGSGWEDNDICAQLRLEYPNGMWLICHDIVVTHRNEMKNQGGEFWNHNKKVYEAKWGPNG